MSDTMCTDPGQREAALVAYVYGEMSIAERKAFESHLSSCGPCRAELSGFEAVRTRLAAWAPPEPIRTWAPPVGASPSQSRGWAALHEMPAWAQAVAAVLVLGVAAGVANVRVTYGTGGLSVRTGWLTEAPARPAAESPAATIAPASIPPVAPAEPAVTHAELVALEQSLREAIATARNIRPDVIREAGALVAASEKRQQNELALRIGTMAQEARLQREADNAKISRWVGQFTNSADIQARQLQSAVSYAVKVAQQR